MFPIKIKNQVTMQELMSQTTEVIYVEVAAVGMPLCIKRTARELKVIEVGQAMTVNGTCRAFTLSHPNEQFYDRFIEATLLENLGTEAIILDLYNELQASDASFSKSTAAQLAGVSVTVENLEAELVFSPFKLTQFRRVTGNELSKSDVDMLDITLRLVANGQFSSLVEERPLPADHTEDQTAIMLLRALVEDPGQMTPIMHKADRLIRLVGGPKQFGIHYDLSSRNKGI